MTLFKNAEKEVLKASDDTELKWTEYLKVDRSFHEQLVKACNNPFWDELYINIRNRMQVLFFRMKHMPEQISFVSEQHEAILDAMINEQFGQAKKHLRAHILHARDAQKRAAT